MRTDIAEAKGRSQLFERQSPQLLKALREMALIQSAEFSSRIEGVTVEHDGLWQRSLSEVDRLLAKQLHQDAVAEGLQPGFGNQPALRS
jgi:hypothetical protein